jgi:hypothetical protein
MANMSSSTILWTTAIFIVVWTREQKLNSALKAEFS